MTVVPETTTWLRFNGRCGPASLSIFRCYDLIALLLLVSGSLALVELHDRQGLGVDEALGASLWAVNVLIAASQLNVA